MRSKVGIDIGKSSFKYVSEFGRGEIPSYIARGVITDIVTSPDALHSCITYAGADYIIGEDATLGTNFKWKTDEEKGDESNLIFILGVLARLKVQEADIVVGLPVKTAENKKKRDSLKSMFTGIKTAIINGKPMVFDITTSVVAEPLGTYFSLVLDDDSKPLRTSPYFHDEMAIIDIGHRTVDIVTLRGGKLSATKDSTMSGAVTMFEKAEKWLEKEYGALKPNERVKVHFTVVNDYGSPTLKVGGEFVRPDFWNVVSKFKAQLAKDIMDEVRSILNNIQPDRMLLTGGGAELLKRELLAIDKNLIFHEDPKFANATGFYRVARAQRYYGATSPVQP